MTWSFLVNVVMPLVALFNGTEPLYVIPVSYFVAKGIGSGLKIGNKIWQLADVHEAGEIGREYIVRFLVVQ